MRRIIPNPANAVGGHKHRDVDGPRAFQSHAFQFVVFEKHIVILATLVALDLVLLGNRFAADSIYISTFHPIVDFGVQGVKPHTLSLVAGCIDTGQLTKDSLRYPFQNARGAMR